MNLVKISIILISLFYTEKGYQDNAYQDMLFTTKGKIDRNNHEFGGITFKIGGSIENITLWERYRIGYPFGAITIDHQKEAKITQGRFEIDAVIINFLFALLCIYLLNLLNKLRTSYLHQVGRDL